MNYEKLASDYLELKNPVSAEELEKITLAGSAITSIQDEIRELDRLAQGPDRNSAIEAFNKIRVLGDLILPSFLDSLDETQPEDERYTAARNLANFLHTDPEHPTPGDDWRNFLCSHLAIIASCPKVARPIALEDVRFLSERLSITNSSITNSYHDKLLRDIFTGTAAAEGPIHSIQ